MKIIFFILSVAVTWKQEAQTVKPFLDAMIKMDQSQLEKILTTDISCSIDGVAISGKQNSIAKLQSFINSHMIRSGKTIHEGLAKGTEAYMGIASLSSDKSKFRIYITFIDGDQKGMVQKVKIERDLF